MSFGTFVREEQQVFPLANLLLERAVRVLTMKFDDLLSQDSVLMLWDMLSC